MTRVNAPVYVGGTFYSPDGPDVADEHLALIGGHLFDERPDVADPSGEGGDAGAPERPDNRAGVAKWREYAEALGLDVPEDADKAAVQALVAEHDAAGADKDGSDDANGADA